MLEHTAVPLLFDILEILTRGPAGRIALTHVTEAAGKLREPLTVGGLTNPLHRQMAGLNELGTREHGNGGLAEDRGVRKRHGKEIG